MESRGFHHKAGIIDMLQGMNRLFQGGRIRWGLYKNPATLVYALAYKKWLGAIYTLPPHTDELISKINDRQLFNDRNPEELLVKEFWIDLQVHELLEILKDQRSWKKEEWKVKLKKKSVDLFKGVYLSREKISWKRRYKYLVKEKSILKYSAEIDYQFDSITKSPIFHPLLRYLNQKREKSSNNYLDAIALCLLDQKLRKFEENQGDQVELPVFFSAQPLILEAVHYLSQKSEPNGHKPFTYNAKSKEFLIVRNSNFFLIDSVFNALHSNQAPEALIEFTNTLEKIVTSAQEVLSSDVREKLSDDLQNRSEEKVFLEFFDRWWSEKGMDELLDVLNENYFLDSDQKRAELDEHINRYIEEEREKLNRQFYHYSGRIALIKKIWDSLLDLPAMLEERFSLSGKGLNVYKELGSRFSYPDNICEEIQSLIDRIFLLVHNNSYSNDLESVESEIVADLLIGSFEEVKTQEDKVNKIDKLAKGLAVLWIFEKYDLMEEVCSIVRKYMESKSSEGDKYPSATIALLHAAAIFKGTTKDLKKALNIIGCVEEKFGKNNYKVWIGLSYLYYLLWDELGDMLIFPEMVYVKTRKNADHNDHNKKYLNAAINYSKMAVDWLEKLLKDTNDLNKQKHRQRAYYYALNNYIFFQTYHASTKYFLHLTPLAEKLEHISRNADVWHEDRFPDTLARYYYRSAFLSSNEKDFKFNLDEALFYNELSIKYSKRINPIYRMLQKDLEQLKSKGFVYTRRVLKIFRQASST